MKIQELVLDNIHQSYTYQEYKALINKLYAEGKTTGNDQSEAYMEYTKLALSRMKRWEKVAVIEEDIMKQLQKITIPQTWLVITEAWCGDAAHALPILEKVALINPLISLQVVLRDDHEALMNAFLTDGKKSIPKVVGYNTESYQVLFTWGPRPAGATQLVADALNTPQGITPEVKEALQMWFNKDKGKQIASEITHLATRSSIA